MAAVRAEGRGRRPPDRPHLMPTDQDSHMTKLTDNRPRDHTRAESRPGPPAKLTISLDSAPNSREQQLAAVTCVLRHVPEPDCWKVLEALFARGRRTKLHSSDYPPPRTPRVITAADGE